MDCVKALFAAGADVNRFSQHHNTPVMTATEKGHTGCLEQLIKAGADVNIVNLDGDTAVMCAAITGKGKCLSILIEAGADVNIVNNEGYVPIMCFIRQKDEKSIKTLIEAGADVNIVNKLGETAVSIAQAKDSLKRTSVLVQAGAAVNDSGYYPKQEGNEKNADVFNLAHGSASGQSSESKLEGAHNCESDAASLVEPTVPDASEMDDEFDIEQPPAYEELYPFM